MEKYIGRGVLRLKVVGRNSENYFLGIDHQDKRLLPRNIRGSEVKSFGTFNGIKFLSDTFPTFSMCLGYGMLFIRGYEDNNDQFVMTIPNHMILVVKDAVEELNEHYSKKRCDKMTIGGDILRLKEVRRHLTDVFFVIDYQDEKVLPRYHDDMRDDVDFGTYGEINFKSKCSPEYYNYRILFLKGSACRSDLAEIRVPLYKVGPLKRAVEELNEYYLKQKAVEKHKKPTKRNTKLHIPNEYYLKQRMVEKHNKPTKRNTKLHIPSDKVDKALCGKDINSHNIATYAANEKKVCKNCLKLFNKNKTKRKERG